MMAEQCRLLESCMSESVQRLQYLHCGRGGSYPPSQLHMHSAAG